MNAEEMRDKLNELLGGGVEWSPGPVDAAATVPNEKWYAAALSLRDLPDFDFAFLRSLTAVDRPTAGRIEVVAHLFSYKHRHALVLKTQVDRAKAELPTVSDVWPAANWHEREVYDLFGVRFHSHPDMRRLLMPEDWVGYPLRKDYAEPADYHGIPTRRQARGAAV